MPCDRNLKAGETLQQRKETIRDKVMALSKALAIGTVRAKVGPQGAITFVGWADRGPVTDSCAYRAVMAKGSALAKLAIEAAETAAGHQVNRQVVGQGVHSHDGVTWHNHKG